MFNTHNLHEWRADNPNAVRVSNYQHRFSVNVWAGIVDNYLIGPYLMPCRLTGNVYETFLMEVLPRLLDDVPLAVCCRMWYQHDGAPAHFHSNVRRYLDNVFPNKWIGRNGPVSWPARSPDMTPSDFFLWVHTKTLIYETPVETEMDLVARITVAAGQIAEDPQLFENVRRSIRRRYQTCIDVGGRHFEHLL